MKKIIDILGIVLPALILLLGIIRLFSTNRRGHNALTMFFAVLLLFLGTIRFLFLEGGGSSNNGPKPLPLSVSKHSDVFNTSVETMLDAYYKMTEAFVSWDTAIINSSGNELKRAIDSLKMDELKKDTLIYQTTLEPLEIAKTELNSILTDPSIAEKRGSLNILSDNLRTLLVIVKYDKAKVYWQECPMAFGDDKPGNWLSKTKAVRNPYLGTKDPKYGSDMLNCGGPKDTINFVPVETTKN
jgi:hypothetical protein